MRDEVKRRREVRLAVMKLRWGTATKGGKSGRWWMQREKKDEGRSY